MNPKKPGQGKDKQMRTLCMLLMAVFLLPMQAMGNDLSDLLPESVGRLIRVELVTGPDAQAEVDALHGKALVAEASAVARYGRMQDTTGRPAEVWVSRVSSEREARRQTGLMVHNIYENPRSPFKNPTRTDHDGIAVYRFTGMGQAHLIWFSGDLVWWVSTKPRHEADFLTALCQQR